MHTYKIPLKTSINDERALSKAYFWMFKLHNQIVSYAIKCFRRLNSNKDYHYLLKEYRALKNTKHRTNAQDFRKKEIGILLNKIQKDIGLSKAGFYKFVKIQQKKYSKYISSQQAQKEAERVWNGVSKVLFSDGHKIHFKKATNFRTITGKSPENGIKFRDDHILFGDLKIPCKLEHSDYEKETLNHDLKYCELVRERFNSGYRYYVNLYLDGTPPVKYKIGKGRTGIDPGVSTIAAVSSGKVLLKELAPNCKKYNKKIIKLQQRIDVSTKKSNPFNYNSDGTAKEGRHDWRYSNSCKRKKWLLSVLYAKKSRYIKCANNAIANEIVSMGKRIIIEKINFKGLAKKAKQKETPKTEKERCKKRKRFGSSMNNRSPAYLISTIERKVIEQGGSIYKADPRVYKGSQFNHDIKKYLKIPLQQRFKEIDKQLVQRDLYSAFLYWNVDETNSIFDTDKCNLRFSNFITMQNELINNMKNNNISMKQCFGF